jgi:predicted dehydrogenase
VQNALRRRINIDNKKLRVGIIGGSVNNGWAKRTHIPAVKGLPELELSAVGTSNMESAEKSALSLT